MEPPFPTLKGVTVEARKTARPVFLEEPKEFVD
jgi:hypothetical protein